MISAEEHFKVWKIAPYGLPNSRFVVGCHDHIRGRDQTRQLSLLVSEEVLMST